MTFGMALTTLAGLLLAFVLLQAEGFGLVFESVARVEWRLLAVLLLHLGPVIFSALAWHGLLAGMWPPPLWVFVRARWIREAVNDLLPVAQIGGHMVGARLLTLHGAKAGIAGASVVVDVTMRLLAQLVFAFLGLALLLSYGNWVTPAMWWGLGGIMFGGLSLLGFFFAQRWGLFKILERFLLTLAKKWDLPFLGNLQDLHDTIQQLYDSRSRLFMSGVYHLLALGAGTVEIWVVLFCMGHPIEPGEALLVESLGQAVKMAGFAVPGALGVQEGAYVALGTFVGVNPADALGLSLVKRFRDVVLGLPALLVWHFYEGKTIRRVAWGKAG